MTDQQKEQRYLDFVYGRLEAKQAQLVAYLEDRQAEGRKNLQGFGTDLRLNFDNFADSLDTFAAVEMKNREIDQANFALQTAESELAKVRRLLPAPYFGKVSVDFLEDTSIEDFYIGINGFTDETNQDLIYDWRSPVAELFYSNRLGSASYKVHQQEIIVNIQKRRQFILKRNRLLQSFDTTVAIQDDVLLAALAKDSADKMKEITASIQKEQNSVIRDLEHRVVMVNGVAGSGKTSVIMQRIAYLLYRYRQQMTAANLLILSPNAHFIEYISGILPSLGEENPLNLTLLQFVQRVLSDVSLESEGDYFQRISQNTASPQVAILRSRQYLEDLKTHGDARLLAKGAAFKEVTVKGKVMISKAQIQAFYEATPANVRYRNKIQAVKRRLSEWWENRLRRQAQQVSVQEQILTLSEKQQLRYFGELIQDESPKALARYAHQRLRAKYRSVTEAIQANHWLDEQALLTVLLPIGYTIPVQQKITLDEAVIYVLIRHWFIEKVSVPDIQCLLIDEVQDYTPTQLLLLQELFPKAAYTMVGDENQAIFDTHITFQQLAALFPKVGTKRYTLQNSYRSTGAITQLFAALVADPLAISPVRPQGTAPEFREFCDLIEFQKMIEQILAERPQQEFTLITKTEEEKRQLQQLFSAFTGRLKILTISLAKGLEFDHVILYDISAERYCSPREKRQLYTAISRSMQTLILTFCGNLPQEL